MDANEPVRKTSWVIGTIFVVLTTTADVLTTSDVKGAIASGLVVLAGFVLTGEIARRKVVGPETFYAETGKKIESS